MHRIIGIFLLTLMAISLNAQRNGNSPYSRFGIGDMSDNSFMHLRQMGSIGSSYVDGYHVNLDNPASFAFLRATAFDIGMEAKRATLTEGGTVSDPIWSGNLQYISLAFPLQNDLNQLLDREIKPYRFGMGFTLAPVSNVAYNISSIISDPENGEVTNNYNGKGGANKFVWSTGFKYNDFAIGTNLGVLFGKIEYERSVRFNELDFSYTTVFDNEYNMNGFLFDIGLLYNRTLNKKAIEEKSNTAPKRISIGLRYSNTTSLSTNSNISEFGFQDGLGDVQVGREENDIKGSGKLPSSLGFGASYYGANRIIIGFDIRQTYWDGYFNEATGEAKETLKNTTSMSLGGYYRPNYKSYTNYWKRVYYRYGFYTRTDPRAVNGTQVSSYGVTAGFGLPFVFQRKISHANLGIELGKRGGGTPIEESFLKISLGFTFNDDEWFIQRKYN